LPALSRSVRWAAGFGVSVFIWDVATNIGALYLDPAMIKRTSNKNISLRLHDSYLTLIHTRRTKIMRGLTVLHSFLQRKHKTAKWQLLKFVAFRLSLKVFELSQFAFQFGYFVGERRLFLLTGERNSRRTHELCAYLTDCGNKLGVIGKAMCSFDKLSEGFSTLDCGNNFSVHSKTPNLN